MYPGGVYPHILPDASAWLWQALGRAFEIAQGGVRFFFFYPHPVFRDFFAFFSTFPVFPVIDSAPCLRKIRMTGHRRSVSCEKQEKSGRRQTGLTCSHACDKLRTATEKRKKVVSGTRQCRKSGATEKKPNRNLQITAVHAILPTSRCSVRPTDGGMNIRH